MINLTFEDVCKLVEKDADQQILQATKGILDVILILSGVAIGSQVPLPPDAIGLIASLIEVKNEMTARILPQVLKVLNWVTGRKPETPREKEQRMAAAYVLICYAAFFEALEKVLPDLMKAVELKPSEKHRLSASASERLKICDNHQVQLSDSFTSDLSFHLPHPTETFETVEQRLLPIYERLAKGFLSFLECLVIWEEADDKQKLKIQMALRGIPKQAFEHFKGHYYALGAEYNEFFVWAVFHSFEETQNDMVRLAKEGQVQTDNITGEMQKIIHFVEESCQTIDIGFNNLEQLVIDLSAQEVALEETEALEILSRRYLREVDEDRIIKDEYETGNGEIHLIYPKRSEIFIPQSYRFLRYSGKGRLESDQTWKGEPRHDFGTFLINYLKLPHSLYTPLVVLGHPGSGKSMLTHFIAARMKSSSFTPIRIELRKINAELPIRDQIVNQIKDTTGSDVRWSRLRRIFQGRPMLVILDGYDELLQASGKTFTSYLREVSAFQKEAYLDHNQPVHAIVTSRITLIDQAMIPAGATIVRLEPFSEEQCNRWVNIWNEKNSSYFEAKDVRPFVLPIGNAKLMELAEQPLLLLMLALYDSKDNALQEKVDLSRTVLYDDLLRRFVKRQREKDDPLGEIAPQLIETDMRRLGAVAVSMFNRRALDIKSDQLDRDLAYFGLEREIKVKPQSGGSELSQGQLLFGSFFFVHKAESTRDGAVPSEQKKDEAYEFLHNTFGEFLTADFILRHLMQQVATVHEYKQSKRLRSELPAWLEKRDGLSKEWFSTLIYTLLSSRPVVLEMMRERLQHYEEIERISRQEFLASLNEIVKSQISRLLEKREFPPMMSAREENSFGYLPLLGHAVLSLHTF